MKVRRISTELKTNHGQTMEINRIGKNNISLVMRDPTSCSTCAVLLFEDEIEMLVNLIRETATGELDS